jgi:hypothetical protein
MLLNRKDNSVEIKRLIRVCSFSTLTEKSIMLEEVKLLSEEQHSWLFS